MCHKANGINTAQTTTTNIYIYIYIYTHTHTHTHTHTLKITSPIPKWNTPLPHQIALYLSCTKKPHQTIPPPQKKEEKTKKNPKQISSSTTLVLKTGRGWGGGGRTKLLHKKQSSKNLFIHLLKYILLTFNLQPPTILLNKVLCRKKESIEKKDPTQNTNYQNNFSSFKRVLFSNSRFVFPVSIAPL